MRYLTPAVLTSAVLVLLLACSSNKDDTVGATNGDASSPSSNAHDGASDVSTDRGEGTLGDAAAEVCNALTLDGMPEATFEIVTDAAPAGLGGTLVDGTYALKKVILYGSTDAVPADNFAKGKLVLSGKTGQTVVMEDGADPATTSETYTTDGAKLTIDTTCPAGTGSEVASYTSTGDAGTAAHLILYRLVGEDTTGWFYDRVP